MVVHTPIRLPSLTPSASAIGLDRGTPVANGSRSNLSSPKLDSSDTELVDIACIRVTMPSCLVRAPLAIVPVIPPPKEATITLVPGSPTPISLEEGSIVGLLDTELARNGGHVPSVRGWFGLVPVPSKLVTRPTASIITQWPPLPNIEPARPANTPVDITIVPPIIRLTSAPTAPVTLGRAGTQPIQPMDRPSIHDGLAVTGEGLVRAITPGRKAV